MSHLRSRLEGGLLVGMNSLQGNCRMSEVEPKTRGPLNPFFVCVILSCPEQVMWVNISGGGSIPHYPCVVRFMWLRDGEIKCRQ